MHSAHQSFVSRSLNQNEKQPLKRICKMFRLILHFSNQLLKEFSWISFVLNQNCKSKSCQLDSFQFAWLWKHQRKNIRILNNKHCIIQNDFCNDFNKLLAGCSFVQWLCLFLFCHIEGTKQIFKSIYFLFSNLLSNQTIKQASVFRQTVYKLPISLLLIYLSSLLTPLAKLALLNC